MMNTNKYMFFKEEGVFLSPEEMLFFKGYGELFYLSTTGYYAQMIYKTYFMVKETQNINNDLDSRS